LSYSSLQRERLGGVDQLLILTGDGATSLAPADGAVLWRHEWPVPGGARIVQPTVTPDGGILIGTGFGLGMRRLAVNRTDGDWQTAERWTSRGMKPYYNDFALHRGHVYGFDGRILACLDLETGEREWKGGRYGNGQLLLLPELDLLLVLSDRGDVALVEATPEGFSELARMPAISGKTWNHPVLADGVLYVRNGEEMAAFRMPTEGGSA
jgi:outer membrane protein assembly factor BamB